MATGGLVDFDVHVAGLGAVTAKLGLAKEAVGDLRAAWRAIHAGGDGKLISDSHSFLGIVKGQYATKGSRGGTPWPDYEAEPIYRVIKIKLGGGLDRMLRWVEGRERLYPSLVEPGHPEHIFEATAHAVTMGTAVPHARKHQFGLGIQKWDKIPLPRRPMLALTKEDFRAWVRAVQRHVQRTVGVPGARRTV